MARAQLTKISPRLRWRPRARIRAGRILIDRQASGAYLFNDAPEVAAALRSLRDHAVKRVDLRAHQPSQKGHQHG